MLYTKKTSFMWKINLQRKALKNNIDTFVKKSNISNNNISKNNLFNTYLYKTTSQKIDSKENVLMSNIHNFNLFYNNELILSNLKKDNMFIYTLRNFLQSVQKQNKFLCSLDNGILQINNGKSIKNYFSVEEKESKLFVQYLYNLFFPNNNSFKNTFDQKTFEYNINLTNKQTLLLNSIFILVIKSLIKNNKISFVFNNKFLLNESFILEALNSWSNTNFLYSYSKKPALQFINSLNKYINKNNTKEQLRIKKIVSNLKTGSFSKKNIFLNKIVLQQSLRNEKVSPAVILWKKNNSFFNDKTNRHNFFAQKHINNRTFSKHQAYMLSRIEEKINALSKLEKTEQQKQNLIKLYNLIKVLWQEKVNRQKGLSFILSKQNYLTNVRKKEWKLFLLKTIVYLINKKTKNEKEKKELNFLFKIWTNLTSLRRNIKELRLQRRQLINTKKLTTTLNVNNKIIIKGNTTRNFYWPNRGKVSILNKNVKDLKARNFKQKKAVIDNFYLKSYQHKELFTTLTGKKTSVFFINALSLCKYALIIEKINREKEMRKDNDNFDITQLARKNPNIFLQTIDKEMIDRYKYIGIYIKDLVRIAFIAFSMKKFTFLAEYIAYQIGKLPKNRKETKFIRFIIRVVKVFAAHREEQLGLRIRFKGRVNRWRRTKAILGTTGILPLQTYDNRIEYGSAQAINRKGALGVSIWFRYKSLAQIIYRESLIKYFRYSKRIHAQRIKKSFNHFTNTKNLK